MLADKKKKRGRGENGPVVPLKELQLEKSTAFDQGGQAKKRRNKSETYYTRGVRQKSPIAVPATISPKESASMLIKREKGLKTLCVSSKPSRRVKSRLENHH